jgi:ESCRT-I complex subunit VPS28
MAPQDDIRADLYALIKTTEKLEQAYIRETISAEIYEEKCKNLISQFKTSWTPLKHDIPDIRKFLRQYDLDAPLAVTRLVESGMPATLEHGTGRGSSQKAVPTGALVAEATQNLITLTNAIAMQMKAVDQLYPEVQAAAESLGRVSQLPPNSPIKTRITEWLRKLHALPASHELDDEGLRQLGHEVQCSYNEFMELLREEGQRV